jgi:hypothetical protein
LAGGKGFGQPALAANFIRNPYSRALRPFSKRYAARLIFCGNTERRCAVRGSAAMLDVMYLAIGFGFLAVAVLYVMACDRL